MILEKPNLLLFSGQIGAGKTAAANAIGKTYGIDTVRTRDLLLRRLPSIEHNRSAFQAAGDRLDDITDHSWLREEMDQVFSTAEFAGRRMVLDSIRTQRQLFWLRKSEKFRLAHVHLTASPGRLRHRFDERRDELDTHADYYTVKNNRHESEVASLIHDADLSFDTDMISPIEVARAIVSAIWPDLNPNRVAGTK